MAKQLDPHPECEHEWKSLGWTLICEPPILHAVCFICRTFRHTSDPGSKVAKAFGFESGERIWWTKDWISNSWDWEKEQAKL